MRRDYTGTTAVAADRVTHFVGNAEVVRFASGKIEVRRYLAGVLRVRTKESGRVWERRDFLYTDHLGSTHVIADDDGMPLSTMSFDAFGDRRDEVSWLKFANGGIAYNSSAKTQHGYTGHEQVDSMGLIHMNGRLYAPGMNRFIQADPMVQDATDPASWNRYAYVFNNPLAHTDPTGYWGVREQAAARTVAAIIISYYTGGLAANAATVGEAFWITVAGGAAAGAVQTGNARGAATGAFSAGLFFGIGQHFGDARSVGKTVAHGLAGGVMAELQGGNFGHGFVSAAFSEAINPELKKIDNPVLQGIAHAVAGGTASELAGGKFANGAVTAAFGYAFNNRAHETSKLSASGDAEVALAEIGKTKEGRRIIAEIEKSKIISKVSLWESKSLDNLALTSVHTPPSSVFEMLFGVEETYSINIRYNMSFAQPTFVSIDGTDFQPDLTRVLAHELGHVYVLATQGAVSWRTNQEEAIRIENTISRQIDPTAPIRHPTLGHGYVVPGLE